KTARYRRYVFLHVHQRGHLLLLLLNSPEDDSEGRRQVMLAWSNPFDWRTVLLAHHAQHVVLIHFPIALYVAGVALDLAGLWLSPQNFPDAAYYNFSLAAALAIPAATTGLIAWQWQLEGQKLKGLLLEHLVAGSAATAAIAATWLVQYHARRKNC